MFMFGTGIAGDAVVFWVGGPWKMRLVPSAASRGRAQAMQESFAAEFAGMPTLLCAYITLDQH